MHATDPRQLEEGSHENEEDDGDLINRGFSAYMGKETLNGGSMLLLLNIMKNFCGDIPARLSPLGFRVLASML